LKEGPSLPYKIKSGYIEICRDGEDSLSFSPKKLLSKSDIFLINMC
jgi:hypothetical protein